MMVWWWGGGANLCCTCPGVKVSCGCAPPSRPQEAQVSVLLLCWRWGACQHLIQYLSVCTPGVSVLCVMWLVAQRLHKCLSHATRRLWWRLCWTVQVNGYCCMLMQPLSRCILSCRQEDPRSQEHPRPEPPAGQQPPAHTLLP